MPDKIESELLETIEKVETATAALQPVDLPGCLEQATENLQAALDIQEMLPVHAVAELERNKQVIKYFLIEVLELRKAGAALPNDHLVTEEVSWLQLPFKPAA